MKITSKESKNRTIPNHKDQLTGINKLGGNLFFLIFALLFGKRKYQIVRDSSDNSILAIFKIGRKGQNLFITKSFLSNKAKSGKYKSDLRSWVETNWIVKARYENIKFVLVDVIKNSTLDYILTQELDFEETSEELFDGKNNNKTTLIKYL